MSQSRNSRLGLCHREKGPSCSSSREEQRGAEGQGTVLMTVHGEEGQWPCSLSPQPKGQSHT